MANIIPRRNSIIVVVLCILLIGFVEWFFHGTIGQLNHAYWAFVLVRVILLVAWVFFTIRWMLSLKDDAYEFKSARMWPVVLITAAIILVTGVSAASYRTDAESGIEYHGK